MNDSILNRLVGRNDDHSGRRTEEAELEENLQTFGWLRGTRDRALMLELRHRTGNITCIGYPWLERAEFDPSEGIKLQFGATTIRINGKKLNEEIRPCISLFAGIIRHRVPWIQEAGHLEGRQDSPLIEEIRIS